jgi:hypothetical protein
MTRATAKHGALVIAIEKKLANRCIEGVWNKQIFPVEEGPL